jgi:hypothetical protein
LAAELRRNGLLDPYRRTNARRAIKTIDAAAIDRECERARIGLFYADELPLTVVHAKLKEPPRTREKIVPPSLPLDWPPSIPEMLAGLGLSMTHAEIAAVLGLSRQQVTNIIVGRFGVSRLVAQRVVEVARVA